MSFSLRHISSSWLTHLSWNTHCRLPIHLILTLWRDLWWQPWSTRLSVYRLAHYHLLLARLWWHLSNDCHDDWATTTIIAWVVTVVTAATEASNYAVYEETVIYTTKYWAEDRSHWRYCGSSTWISICSTNRCHVSILRRWEVVGAINLTCWIPPTAVLDSATLIWVATEAASGYRSVFTIAHVFINIIIIFSFHY